MCTCTYIHTCIHIMYKRTYTYIHYNYNIIMNMYICIYVHMYIYTYIRYTYNTCIYVLYNYRLSGVW